MTQKLAKQNYRDTGFLSNATADERNKVIALFMYYQIGRFNPSNPIIVKYRNKDIINLVKEYTKEKLHKTNALAKIYIYIYIKLNMTMTTTVHDTADNMTNTKLSILSLNINGLSEDKKRNKLFENLANKDIDIILIHSTNKSINKWKKEWLGKSFWNYGKIPKSSRVAMLLKKDLEIETHTMLKDEESRILSLNFSLEWKNYQIINIYAPTKNSEKSKFYKHLKNYVNTKQNLILGGDFNMVEDLLLDRQGGNPNNTHMLGSNYLTKIKQTNNLIDIWRKENPDKTLFTFHNKRQKIHSRIDRICIQNKQ